ncbi:hypothetical protein HK405_004372 [Cladochytrium tenue]|nr:hypothetical protein HK405_004372 [Cladochytrium tenue]
MDCRSTQQHAGEATAHASASATAAAAAATAGAAGAASAGGNNVQGSQNGGRDSCERDVHTVDGVRAIAPDDQVNPAAQDGGEGGILTLETLSYLYCIKRSNLKVVDESNEYYYEVVDTMNRIRGNVPKKLFEVLEKVSQRSAATFVDANGLDLPIDEAYTPPPPQQQQQQQQIIPPNKQHQQCTLIPEFGAPPAWAGSGRPPAGYGDYADENIGYKWPGRVNATPTDPPS